MTEFGPEYAKVYDAIYRSKDYDGEVDLIEKILVKCELAGPRRLLDLGCGTGGHALRLGQRGHCVVGIDRSEEMLARASSKAFAASGMAVEFHQADIREIDLGQRFDAVLMMFTVLGYQLNEPDLMAALASVRRHLDLGGLFIFDVWYGPAVVTEGPSERQIGVEHGSAHINRKARGTLDTARHLCRVTFDLEKVDRDGRMERWEEEHVVRYYFYDELKTALKRNGLELATFRRFPEMEAPADERAWNVIGVARAI